MRSTFAVAALALSLAAPLRAQQPVIGLITKTESNPFFVKMREGAVKAAQANGLRLLTGAGRNDGDNASQVTAIENMVAAGAKVILITVNDAKAIVPALRRARDKGVVVIALDSPPDPIGAVDALFATDNYEAGLLIGRYAHAALGRTPPRIATLDLLPGPPVGAQRHNGVLPGMGLSAPDARATTLGRPAEVVCMGDTYGNQARGQAMMESCLQRDPKINVVYTINEPSAAGAARALRAAGRARGARGLGRRRLPGREGRRRRQHHRDRAAVPGEDGRTRRRRGSSLPPHGEEAEWVHEHGGDADREACSTGDPEPRRGDGAGGVLRDEVSLTRREAKSESTRQDGKCRQGGSVTRNVGAAAPRRGRRPAPDRSGAAGRCRSGWPSRIQGAGVALKDAGAPST